MTHSRRLRFFCLATTALVLASSWIGCDATTTGVLTTDAGADASDAALDSAREATASDPLDAAVSDAMTDGD